MTVFFKVGSWGGLREAAAKQRINSFYFSFIYYSYSDKIWLGLAKFHGARLCAQQYTDIDPYKTIFQVGQDSSLSLP